ncbi:MAG: 3-keto-5-aminohexanoate cleavage protein [Thermodesulfobacteriota bacterium]|nr:3-keto-5-aminohexanoate cleavage protein [Thermodesulfobacteriota bacterium]
MEKLIITVAPTGGFHGKEANPALPEQPDEIAQSAYECWNAGASIIHVHARGKDGRPSSDWEVFKDINCRIREKCPDVIIQNTTGGGPGMTFEQRMNSLNAEPEMCSLNMGTMVGEWQGQEVLFSNTPRELERVSKICLEKNIKPEMEVYNLGMLNSVRGLIEKGLLEKPYYSNFVFMGAVAVGALNYSHKHFMYLVDNLPPDSVFNITAIGSRQVPATTFSMLLGGHLRVGFEDNVYYRKGELAESNLQFVERAVRIANELGRPIATPAEAREILGLSDIPRVW